MVVIAAVVVTVTEKAPLVLLREAEQSQGQLDVKLSPDPEGGQAYLNYTQLQRALASTAASNLAYDYHSPRLIVPSTVYAADECVYSSADLLWESQQQAASASQVTVGRAQSQPLLADGASEVVAGSNAWMYTTSTGSACGSQKWSYVHSCLSRRCAPPRGNLNLVLVDSHREARMGYGRQPVWDGRIPPGQVVLHAAHAAKLRVQEGDTLILNFQARELVRHAFEPIGTASSSNSTRFGSGADSSGWDQKAAMFSDVALPFRIFRVVPNFGGKTQSSFTDIAFAEYGSFLEFAGPRLHPLIAGESYKEVVTGTGDGSSGGESIVGRAPASSYEASKAALAAAGVAFVAQSRLYHFASEVNVNIAPSNRVQTYMDSNYDHVRGSVADFASNLLFVAGFTEVETVLPQLLSLEPRRFVTLYLSILLDVLLVVLFVLSVVLIYSLLLINVNARTFELAVRRMLGSGRKTIVALLLFQSASYGLPAWIVGLIVAQIISSSALSRFTNLSGIAVDNSVTAKAFWLATFLATAIPAVASIGPIRVALGPTIRDALDTTRPKSQLVKHKVERSDDSAVPWNVLALGLGMFGFGGAVYYLLPLSLISLNLGLLASLFMSVLLGMLGGLVTLALHLELLLSKIVMTVFVSWWEKAAILKLAAGNLIAHRLRNRKTVLMYSLSISFIVLITVAAEQQIKSASYRTQEANGAPIVVTAPYQADAVTIAAVEHVLGRYTKPGRPGSTSSSASASRATTSGYTSSSVDNATGGAGSSHIEPFLDGYAWATSRLDTSISTAFYTSPSALSDQSFGIGAAGGLYHKKLNILNVGRTYYWFIAPQAVSPSFYEGASGMIASNAAAADEGVDATWYPGASFGQYNVNSDTPSTDESALPVSEQLYTARGSQGTVISSMLKIELGLKRGRNAIFESIAGQQSTSSTDAVAASGRNDVYTRSLIRTLGLMDHSSYFAFSRAPRSGLGAGLLSFPAFSRLADAHATEPGAQRVESSAVQRAWQRQARALPTFNGSRGTDTVAAIRSAALRLLSNGSNSQSSRASRHVRTTMGFEDLPLTRCMIGYDTTSTQQPTTAQIDAFLIELKAAIAAAVVAEYGYSPSFDPLGGWSIYDSRDAGADVDVTIALLNGIFSVLTLVAMALCFFSLFASMVANITEQKKEMGVLRSVGLRTRHVLRMYIHEAFALVMSASLMGIVIGCFVAWTFGKQQELFTSIPMPFVFPWSIAVTLLLASVVAALLSTWLPARRFMKQSITSLLR